MINAARSIIYQEVNVIHEYIKKVTTCVKHKQLLIFLFKAMASLFQVHNQIKM